MKKRLEQIVFIISMVTLAALVGWWLVFAEKLSAEHYETQRLYMALTTSDPALLQQRLAALDARFSGRLVMIVAEASAFGLLLLVCSAVLFMVARQRRLATERMERILQFTTHELKTPIAGVKALLQSMALGSVSQEAAAGFLDQGITECNRLEHLTESILAYQRAFAREQASLVGVHAQRLVEEVLAHRRDTYGKESIGVRIEDARVLIDRDAFRVVLENLLDNARKYGGGLPVDIIGRADAGGYRLEIRDRGIGFQPDQAEALFDPFTRETRHETAKVHGSGLGLYIARQLAERFGAKLTAESEGADKGAAFILALRPEAS